MLYVYTVYLNIAICKVFIICALKRHSSAITYDNIYKMFIVDGTYKGQALKQNECFIIAKPYGSDDDHLFGGDSNSYIKLKNNLLSVDIVAETSGGGASGAASGAVLGFLLLGPVGTVMGAGLGSAKKGSNMLAITFANGDSWIVDKVTPIELASLKRYLATAKISAPKTTLSPGNKQKAASKKQSTKLAIKKPKKPSKDFWNLKHIKGRDPYDDKFKMPKISKSPFLAKWENIEGLDKKAKLILDRMIRYRYEGYCEYKWVYFDEYIESEKELDLLISYTVKDLICDTNLLAKKRIDIEVSEEDIKKFDIKLIKLDAELKEAKDELLAAGFFSKGGAKKKIAQVQDGVDEIKKLIAKARRKIKSSNKSINDSKHITDIKDPLNEFLSIFDKILPDIKKPDLTFKKRPGTNDQEFHLIYLSLFDEIWDKKISDEKNRIKEEEKKKKILKVKKVDDKKKISEPKSNKERLLELKSLLDDELITSEEYDKLKNNLLNSI